MDILAMVKTGLALMAQGRETISAVTDAVRDGQAALNTKDQGELNALLAQEKLETEAAHNALSRAIELAKSK